jgi:hypothetical protein
LNLDQLFDQLVQGLVVEPELALQITQRDTALVVQVPLGSSNGLQKAHRSVLLSKSPRILRPGTET